MLEMELEAKTLKEDRLGDSLTWYNFQKGPQIPLQSADAIIP